MEHSHFLTEPAVFAAEDHYQIMVPIRSECLMWVQVGDRHYYDDTNGILRSLCTVHRAQVPMAELDAAGGYTIHIRPVIHRSSWRSQTGEVCSYFYPFSPVPTKDARAYCISDAHGRVAQPVAAAAAYGDFDFLILNGDLTDCCDDPASLLNLYHLCAALTGGQKPVVYARGNHDLRGSHSEYTEEQTPLCNGRTYYTFRFGSLWGVVLDCGEDKRDDHIECGNVFCCRDFRERETQWLQDLVERSQTEYAAEGVTTRVAIVHYPFPHKMWADYELEEDIYTEWCRLLRIIQPQVMICGHMHRNDVWPVGGEWDTFGQPCPMVLSGVPRDAYFSGCGYYFDEDKIVATHTDSEGSKLKQTILTK